MANTHSTDLERSSSQYWSITDASQTGLDLSGDFTLELWANSESTPGVSDSHYFISKDDGTANDRSYDFVYINQSGTPQIRLLVFQNNTTLSEHNWSQTLTTGQWYHIAVTFDISEPLATQAELFLDTVSQGNGTATRDNISSIQNSSAPFEIGARTVQDPNGYFDGLLDEVRVWGDIRTSTEISDNWKKQLSGSEADLKAYWKFNNNGDGSSGNNNDLTNNNSATFSTDVPFTGFIPKIIMS